MNAPETAAAGDEQLLARRRRSLAASYRLFYEQPVHLVRGEGAWLYDACGRRYLDAYNNVAVVGHANREVVAALCAQAGRLNTHTRYLSEPIVRYAERLLALFPPALDRAIFTCTGSEANDLASRIARAHSGGDGFIVTANAYHGVTEATARLSPSVGLERAPNVRTVSVPEVPADAGSAEAQDAGERLAQAVTQAADELRAAGHKPAALFIDTIMSSDGIRPEPRGLLAGAVAAIHAAGGLFVADEVQAGFGRLGDGMWGFARHGIEPDIVTLGKPMGNGHPLAGVVSRRELLDPFGQKTRYFNTFGGNPVSAAVGLAVLDVIAREQLIAHAKTLGERLRAGVAAIAARDPGVRAVRGAGLFIGVQLADPQTGAPASGRARKVVNGMRERHVLISATGPHADVLKIRPPLVFDAQQAQLFLDTLGDTLAAVS